MKVLVLCHGNVCRSPAAEAVIRHGGIETQSAGFKPGGHRAQKKIREAMSKLGFNLENHRSREVTAEMVEWAEIILIMDSSNQKRFIEKYSFAWRKLKLLGHFANPPIEKIKDPGFMKRGPELDKIVNLIVESSRNFVMEYAQ